MKTISLSDQDRQTINQAVASAESRTTVEIVPVIGESSARYNRADDIAGLWLGLTCLVAVWILLPAPARTPGSWGGLAQLWYPVALVIAVVTGFVIGVVVSHHVAALRRLFIPRHEQQREVAHRLQQIFFDRRIRHTSREHCLLLYVSLFEHQAAILADPPVLDAVSQEAIDILCRDFTTRLKNISPVVAITETVHDAGTLLAEKCSQETQGSESTVDALVFMTDS
ncbi:MAG: hypothetical protein HUJ26_05095 [Planctomycetaceae bacterium]|nr:hypothetical protein [Planctomycetaceae bacterium]